MYSPPITVTSSYTGVAVMVLHIAFGESASRLFPCVAVAVSESSVVASSVVASWVAASCCIPSVAASEMVVVASVDSIYCLRCVVSGVVVPLVVQHPLALSCGFLCGSCPSCFVLSRWCCACLMGDVYYIYDLYDC